MKKNLIFLLGLLFSQLNAQTLFDAERYSNSTIQGSARFAAMGGAFGAVGGDFSAIEINPAASSIFGFSEVGVSLNSIQLKNTTTYFNGVEEDNGNDLSLNQAGIVLVLNEEAGGDWTKLSFAFNYNKTANYDNNFSAIGVNPNRGIDQYFLFYAQGKYLNDISRLDGETFNTAYVDIGDFSGYPAQEALFGYEGFVINPIPLAGTTDPTNPDIRSYNTNTQAGASGYTHEYFKTSSGRTNKYTINLSGVYQDKLYLGFSFNTFNVEYRETSHFYEYGYGPQSGISQLDFTNELITLGTANSFQLGAIYKATPQLRLGLSLESPTYYRLSDQIGQSLNTVVRTENEDLDLNLNPSASGIYTFLPGYQFNSPGSVRGSLAYIINDIGLISFDYSIKAHNRAKFTPENDDYFIALNNQIEDNFQTNQRLQIGGEFRLNPQISLRAGYSTESSSRIAFDNSQSIISGGLGYNFGASNLDIALQLQDLSKQQALFSDGLTDRLQLDQDNLNLVLTYRLKL